MGRLYMPAPAAATGPLPVLVFLHGNHGTCGQGESPRVDSSVAYTDTGTCPSGFVVTPNHRGYDYLARNMASWGFAVISVNANRGITAAQGVEGDSGLNLARGRLVLSHLELLARWNRSGGSEAATGVDLQGRLDLSHVGMMGHSRGGEGVRAAYAQYNDPGSIWPAAIGPMTVRGIFEIAPVDGQTSRTLDAMNTAWNVMVGLCDGDVSNFQGVRPFDRMLRQGAESVQNHKSTLVVWGANHNYFNTEWQTSDSQGCDDHTPIFDTQASGSPQQQQIALASLSAFFRAHVGAESTSELAEFFDPSTPMPASLARITAFGREYVETPAATETTHLVDFADSLTSFGTAQGVVTGLQAMPFDDDRNGLAATWTTAGAGTTLLLPFAGAVDLSAAATVDIDLESAVVGTDLDFDVRLVSAGGESAAVALSSVLTLQGASGRNLFQTARFATAAFTSVGLSAVTGVRLVFARSASGSIVIGGVRASKTALPASPARPVDAAGVPGLVHHVQPAFLGTGQVTDAALAQGSGAHGPDGRPQQAFVNLKVASPDSFPVRAELPVLHLGTRTYDVSGYDAGSLGTLVFKIPVADFKALRGDAPVVVAYGALATSTYIINAGTVPADVLQGVQ